MVDFLTEYWQALVWILVALAAVVIEAQTCDMISIWFVPGALIAMLLSFLPVPFWIQVVVFIALSGITLLLMHTVLKRYLPKRRESLTNVDALVGSRGMVLEEIDNLRERGCVKLQGLEWTARSQEEGVIIPKGAIVTVVAVEGVKLICRPEETN